jgi:MAF protein
LAKLGFEFTTESPDIDETPLPGEPPEKLVARLAEEKAQTVAQNHTNCLIIASDQAAVLDGNILGKPGNHLKAVEQLTAASGETVLFLTSLTLLNSASGNIQTNVVPFSVTFRKLNNAEIERYLEREQPYNCAGSFKSEALGITLFERFEGDYPNTLVGLPLIRLCEMLRHEGLLLP